MPMDSMIIPAQRHSMQRPHPASANGDSPASARAERLHMVLELVSKARIKSQYELQDELSARGIVVNQATLSRDVHALGLLKGKDGYELPTATVPVAADAALALYTVVHAWFASAEAAGSLVVVKTPPGGANPLALALDRAGWNEVVGTIAGDDTFFVATRTPADAKRVAKALADIKNRKQPR
jgi:transcriptional regulator of arginine metabolism